MMLAQIATRFPTGLPRLRLWTVDQFHHLGDLGMFEGTRAMLIDGILVEEGPMNPPHRIALELTENALRSAFGTGWRVCNQLPLILGQTIDPQPDLAIIPGSPRGITPHPTGVALVVEVSDSSPRFDTTTKLSIYAAGGIAEYWVVDVANRQLLVFRDPQPDTSQSHGHGYATQLTLSTNDAIAPLAAPNSNVRVADLLP